jgi:hypothetical protein
MTPDQSHTHHRLIRFGLSPKAAVILLWGVTLFFGWQMLGQVAPYGLFYTFGSYVVALGVANVIMEQRRKNLRTLRSDLKEEMLYLVGLRDAGDSARGDSLREIVVEQIRREALYRRMVQEDTLQAEDGDPESSSGATEREPNEPEASRRDGRKPPRPVN